MNPGDKVRIADKYEGVLAHSPRPGLWEVTIPEFCEFCVFPFREEELEKL